MVSLKWPHCKWKSSGTQTLLRRPDYGLVYCYFMGVLPEFSWWLHLKVGCRYTFMKQANSMQFVHYEKIVICRSNILSLVLLFPVWMVLQSWCPETQIQSLLYIKINLLQGWLCIWEISLHSQHIPCTRLLDCPSF